MDYSILSKQVLDNCLGVSPRQKVWINSWDHTLELASHLALECKKRRCEVLFTVQPEELWLRSIIEAPTDLVDRVPAHQEAALKETDVYIYTLGPRRPIPWKKIPSERRNLVTLWFLENNNFVKQWKSIASARMVKMLGIEATLATEERAKALGLDYDDYRNVMFEGCLADYREIANHCRKLAQIIGGEAEVHVTTPRGTDFKFKLAKRSVDLGHGLADEKKAQAGRVTFLPAGGVEVTADERSAEGRVVYDVPIHTVNGPVENLTLTVENGRITESSASSHLQLFKRYLQGKGDVDRFAFFGLGLNPKLRFGFTQDDKVLGSTIINFGNNQGNGGKNRAEGGWWGCMRHATIKIAGKPVMKEGKLLV